jgi:hypothetical protein
MTPPLNPANNPIATPMIADNSVLETLSTSRDTQVP